MKRLERVKGIGPSTRSKVSLQGRPEIMVTGSIREISPEADSTTGTYQVKVTLPSPPLLEMRLGAVVVGRVEIQGHEVVSLPPTALLQSGDGPQVWVVGVDSKVHHRPVELLEFDANSVVISRGLSPERKSSPPASICWPKASL